MPGDRGRASAVGPPSATDSSHKSFWSKIMKFQYTGDPYEDRGQTMYPMRRHRPYAGDA